jgi:hypothetical protein
MAKKPMKISEILAKKSSSQVPTSELDFIAESQNLINQYSKDSATLAKVNDAAIPPKIDISLATPFMSQVEFTNIVKEETTLSNEATKVALNAPTLPTVSDHKIPYTNMGNVENEALNASISNSNNCETIAEQLRNDSVTESGTITELLRNCSVIKAEQFRNKNMSNSNNSVTTPKQLRNDSVTESGTHSVTITEQLRNNSVTTNNPPSHANRLAGNKLTIIKTILDFCQERGSVNTGPISREVFESRTGIDGEVIRVTCNRLVKEGYLNVIESKRGNGGYTIYELHPNTHSQLISGYIRNNSVTIAEQKRNNSGTESVTDTVTNAPSKIDSKYINNITNYLEKDSTTTTWFKELDFSKVSPIGPMMVNSSIRNLVHQKLNPDVVQDFINRFTSWIATQSKVNNFIGTFCDRLKELANEGDSAILSCMTDEERIAEAEFAKHVDKARVEMELIKKSQQVNIEQEKESKFEAWFSSVDEQEKLKLAKPSAMAPADSEAYKRLVKAVYCEIEN